MPQFDESFLSDCALADRWHFYSYTVKQLPPHPSPSPKPNRNPYPSSASHDDDNQHRLHHHHNHHHHNHHRLWKTQRQSWSPRDSNNNHSPSSNGNGNCSSSNCNCSSSSSTCNSISATGNTLHSIKFHRRRKYKKLARLALSTPAIPLQMDVDVTVDREFDMEMDTPVPLKNAVCHGSISSPSTPGACSSGIGVGGGGCSSSSNNSINSGSYSTACTPPPPTHHHTQHQQLQGTPAGSSRVGGAGGAGGAGGGSGVPPAPPSAGSSGHKNSLKGTKLARRARSFKDDLIEKISLMRTTNNTLGRSHSPHSPRTKHGSKAAPTTEEVQRSTQTLETHVKDISNALKHFRDVILKKKLEVLPGNGTVILETIASMYSVIQTYTLNENSAIMSCATQQVYQSLGKLIKLCDEVMLSEDSGECASLSNENVREVIDLLEDAVRNLVTLAQGKLKEQDQCAFRYGGSGLGGIGAAAEIMGAVTASPGVSVPGTGIMRVSAAESAAQRTSLPDIALTPKERDILEQHNVNPMRGSHSTESILRDTSPPPKPPLPNRASNPPPLPPKRRSQPGAPAGAVGANQASPLPYAQSHNISLNSDLDCSSNISLLNYGVDRLSVRSRSPDENSQCSFDSALNHSREEEDHQQQRQQQLSSFSKMPTMMDEDMDKMVSYKSTGYAGAAIEDKMQTPPATGGVGGGVVGGTGGAAEGAAAAATGGGETNSNRHSNESGFVSMREFRTSTQTTDYSIQSSTKSSSSNSEIAFSISESTAVGSSSEYQQISQSVSHSQRHISSSSSSCTTTTTSSSTTTGYGSSSSELEQQQQQQQTTTPADLAPALPPKSTQRSSLTRHESPVVGDELDEAQSSSGWASHRSSQSEVAELRQLSPLHHLNHHPHTASAGQLQQWHSKHHSLIEGPRLQLAGSGSCSAFDQRHLDQEPPPLPMKKKHILAYMEICSASTRSIEQHRHTMHACNISRNISHSQTMNIMPMSKELSPELEIPPALPPKNYKQRKATSMVASPTLQPIIVTTPPPSPKPALGENGSTGRPDSRMATVCEELNDAVGSEDAMPEPRSPVLDSNENVSAVDDVRTFYFHSHQLPGETKMSEDASNADQPITTSQVLEEQEEPTAESRPLVAVHEAGKPENADDEAEAEAERADMLINMLEEVNITRYLILKKREEDGPEVKGGYIDALIVHASRVQKVADNGRHSQRKQKQHKHTKSHSHGHLPNSSVVSVNFHSVRAAFCEAFITTFRTFIQPIDVIEKLTHRYTYFFCQVQDNKQKAAKETFALLVRVVNDLTSTDLTSQLLSLLVEFVYQLVCSGQLYLAKLLRNKFVEKVTLYKEPKVYGFVGELGGAGGGPGTGIAGSGGCSAGGGGNQPSLLDLKSLEIAEQMTLLDAELFTKIEIPEVLLFAKDQCEEKSPNLNKFTEHFNKMSYWARSKILRLQDAKEREKHVNKFIKIMKHLRKMNNYNSYLALLSALDSGPIRRLEWQKGITEEVGSFCALIDSSSSFRAYRQALAETNPPCIPYIGLILQDLTFVHVGNQDYLSKGVINFSKRWQQYNIIDNMKRFKKCAYPFRRNERIIRFFDNFKDFMGEEEMWQISEKIKPRGRRPVNY
ncbi:guanine nucleotide-releasing factor 2 isoform X5 [Drosophila teissieri]|uniref:guanine nucleotide-releasing factor 2 isoform X5 n=1 Tax=Drosophila teissieri TaxID=7243 RepID=UPI001CBA42F1|nr:guanine nucleotide-releasing factor 2 isoform X5 [Drosophila teissieri]